MFRTINKNWKNKVRAAFNAPGQWMVYRLDLGFQGKAVSPTVVKTDLYTYSHAKLTESKDTYCMQVHGNLWYEKKKVAADPAKGSVPTAIRAAVECVHMEVTLSDGYELMAKKYVGMVGVETERGKWRVYFHAKPRRLTPVTTDSIIDLCEKSLATVQLTQA